MKLAWLWFIVVALSYFGLAKLGFLWAISPGNICAVWLPAGLALSALQVSRSPGAVAAGVWCGSVSANLFEWDTQAVSPAKVLSAVMIATASTIQAWLAARQPLHPATDAPRAMFLWFARTMVCCLVAGVVGPVTLYLTGFTDVDRLPISVVTRSGQQRGETRWSRPGDHPTVRGPRGALPSNRGQRNRRRGSDDSRRRHGVTCDASPGPCDRWQVDNRFERA